MVYFSGYDIGVAMRKNNVPENDLPTPGDAFTRGIWDGYHAM